MEQQTTTKGIPGSWLKIIAVLTMLVDHTAATILERMLLQQPAWGPVTSANWDSWYTLYMILRCIGRMAFPIYCFLLIEGYTYTKSRTKYALRLFVFALLSEIPFDLALGDSVFDFHSNNVFFTLLIGLLTVIAADFVKESIGKKAKLEHKNLCAILSSVLTVLVLLAGGALAEYVLHSDYGAAGVLAIFALYVFKENRMLGFAAAVVMLSLLAGNIEIAALLMLIPLRFYNGTRGRQMKYFFYAFYPVHLLVLAGICYMMGLGQ